MRALSVAVAGSVAVAVAVAGTAFVARGRADGNEDAATATGARTLGPVPGAPAASLRQEVVITATVDPERHRIRGQATFTFTNTSRVPLATLVFHRYLEAFRPGSVFMRESDGALRGVHVRGRTRGGTELQGLTVDGIDRLPFVDRELEPRDFTQFSVPLAAPLAPAAVATIRIDFVTTLPALAVRAGYVGEWNLVAQWFPKPAKLEDDGTWASFPYHGNGEFYADFARYDVSVTAPRGYAVEGTGTRLSSRTTPGGVTHRFVAAPVHDAAYVVAPALEVLERRCHGVDVRVAYPMGFRSASAEHLDATCFGLGYFGARLGRYPYPTLTVLVPPEGAEGGAGMEYPSAFITDGPWYRSGPVPYAASVETTLHELGHQWFQGLVASHEVEHPVLDEGLTSFIGYDALAAYLGRPDPSFFDVWRPFVMGEHELPPGLTAYAYDTRQYGSSVYGRSALVLESLCRTYGRARIYRALGRYARAFRFRHPVPSDLVSAFDAELGHRFGARVLAPLLLDGQRIVVRATRAPDGTFVATRTGPLDVPIELELRTGGDRHDSSTRRIRWSGSTTYRDTRRGPGSRCLVIDPDRKVLLDESTRDDVLCQGTRATPLGRLVRVLLAATLHGVAP